MMVRFNIEQRHLVDVEGKPMANVAGSVTFHTCEAASADEAVRLFVKRDDAAVIGDIQRFPGLQAIATVRMAGGVYTLEVTPSTETRRLPVR